MAGDAEGIVELLTAAQCFALLAAGAIGRVAYTRRALPALALVRFGMHADRLYVRAVRPQDDADFAGTVVAFAADNVNDDIWWHVGVTGMAYAAQLPARISWGRGGWETGRPVTRIEPGMVQGWRMVPATG